MTTRIERAAEADLVTCASIMASQEPWITLRRDARACLTALQNPSLEVYVAKEGGEIAGLVVTDAKGAFSTQGYIAVLAVRKDSQRRGIGKALLKFAEERLFDGAKNVFLCVSSFNRDALRFYEREGYEKVGELRDYIVPGHSEFIMRKSRGPLND